MTDRRHNPGAPSLPSAWKMAWLAIGVFAAVLWVTDAFAQVGGPNSGVWLIGPERHGFQTITGPHGQVRHYSYPPGYRSGSGCCNEIHGYQVFGQALKDIKRGNDARRWLDAELEREIRDGQ